ncbi:MAG: hypothetical protein K9K37_12705 [Desulfocapsa sp.]|nr:hypothetical protein [Desulfocapsa sp.]
MKKELILFVAMCLVTVGASSAFAATLTQLGAHPFSQEFTTEKGMRTMINNNNADLQTGFAKAGNSDLFKAFIAQFPTAKVESIQVAPGERLDWMLFRTNGTGPVKVVNDVTWGGNAAFDAFRFFIDKDGQRYEFIVPGVCGNLSLRNVSMIPVKPAVVPEPVAVTPEPVPMIVEERRGGPVVDVGLAHQFDPASYVFARAGYEFPLTDNLTAMGLIGGFIRFDGDDGGDAFVADALLNYYVTEKMFIGGGVGFWSGNDGNVDLIINTGYLVYENPDVMKISIFVEGRCEADNLVSSKASRLGAGLRFQF